VSGQDDVLPAAGSDRPGGNPDGGLRRGAQELAREVAVDAKEFARTEAVAGVDDRARLGGADGARRPRHDGCGGSRRDGDQGEPDGGDEDSASGALPRRRKAPLFDFCTFRRPADGPPPGHRERGAAGRKKRRGPSRGALLFPPRSGRKGSSLSTRKVSANARFGNPARRASGASSLRSGPGLGEEGKPPGISASRLPAMAAQSGDPGPPVEARSEHRPLLSFGVGKRQEPYPVGGSLKSLQPNGLGLRASAPSDRNRHFRCEPVTNPGWDRSGDMEGPRTISILI
jgi:hypothetical protein